jgi:hypothetical protein
MSDTFTAMRREDVPILTEVGDYAGQEAVKVSCTQLGTRHSSAQARRVVADWMDFFSSGPSAIRDLEFVTRTPERLFACLQGQTQLRRLAIKWGDYEDLSAVSGLHELRVLTLRGASGVTSVRPLADLVALGRLEIDGLSRARDMAPLGSLVCLTALELGGNWTTPRNAHVDSIRFLRHLTRLKELVLHTIIVDDLDYTPLLALPRLKSVRVMNARGMTPTLEQLKAALPWSS